MSEVAETVANVSIVSAKASDLAYVLSRWGRMLEQKLEAVPRPGFLHDFAPIQAKLIKRSQVLCAMRDGKIAGFIVYEPGYLHWIYTRKEFTRRGIGRTLLTHSGLVRPIVTTWCSDLRHVGLADASYYPFWLRL